MSRWISRSREYIGAHSIANIVATFSVAVVLLLIAMGSVPLQSAAALGLVGLAVLIVAACNQKQLWNLTFFAATLFLAIPRREFQKIDLVSVGILVLSFLLLISQLSHVPAPVKIPKAVHAEHLKYLILLTLLTFAIVMIVSTSIQGTRSLISVIPWLAGNLICAVVTFVRPNRLPTIAQIRRALFCAVIFVVSFDFLSLMFGSGNRTGGDNAGRFTGSLGDYELAAEFYGISTIILVATVVFDSNKRLRFLSGIYVPAAVSLLLATESRSALILTAIGTPLLFVISTASSRKMIAVTVMFSAFFGSAYYYVITSSAVTFGTLTRLRQVESDSTLQDALNRGSVWRTFNNMANYRGQPLFGNGFDYPYALFGTYPHSLYLWLRWSGGYVATICVILLIVVLLSRMLIGMRANSQRFALPIVLLSFMAIDQVKIEVSRLPAAIHLFWIIIAVAIVACRGSKLDENREEAFEITGLWRDSQTNQSS